MYIALIIISLLLWIASAVCMWKRQLLAPALSYIALLVLSFAQRDGMPLLPFNNTILISWLVITLVVMMTTMLQAPQITSQTRGVSYMAVGAFVGMVVGLLGYTVSDNGSVVNGIMIICTLVGEFFGYLVFCNSPGGAGLSLRNGSARFFRYLLAKGFPIAITVMMLGLALLLAILTYLTPTT